MSARAAWRLEQLGVEDVVEYTGGKMDWLAQGLEYEGTADLIGRHLQSTATCLPDEKVASVADRLGEDPFCVVVSVEQLVVGVLTGHALVAHREDRAGDVVA